MYMIGIEIKPAESISEESLFHTGEYHLIIAAWIINSRQEALLTKRHPNEHYANLWECTDGSVLAVETSRNGALREVNEEIGINLSDCKV